MLLLVPSRARAYLSPASPCCPETLALFSVFFASISSSCSYNLAAGCHVLPTCSFTFLFLLFSLSRLSLARHLGPYWVFLGNLHYVMLKSTLRNFNLQARSLVPSQVSLSKCKKTSQLQCTVQNTRPLAIHQSQNDISVFPKVVRDWPMW